ncbi:sensor histidine kinase [Nonomuraea africana]|uniref:histidine kinase n=1 Tax=Nonomuraea africana TaxID=46171 RepID=A0ABR9KRM3_9ACTN|nr:nitrate- and nitrite sensing domain-containing protein [Nonomuraea africana]MBE1564678.1 two-component sensor histidine kinase [Nonomuraea africana]
MASGRSIRFKIATLLVVPLVSLVALWGFAASTTAGEAFNLLKVDTIWSGVINDADILVYNLQQERLASAERMAGGATARGALAAARANTDKVRRSLTRSANSDDTQAVLTHDMQAQLRVAFAQADRLGEIRRLVDEGRQTPSRLVADYAAISDAIYRLYGTFALSTDVTLYQQATGLIAADQARELLHRQHTLVVASGGVLAPADRELMAKLEGARTLQFERARIELDGELRRPFDTLAGSAPYLTMQGAISSLLSGGTTDVAEWRAPADLVLKNYTNGTWDAGDLLLARMEPAGMSILTRAVVAGVLGLIAVAFSIFISIRVGRVVTTELATLRRTALELAEIRLPRVVARLRGGESVDVAAEAPPIDVPPTATSEIRDLATAFDTVQSTAVEAAVEQARLREGVALALRNLARRSQGLLQRQLKLLDGMQREAEDPDALESLFKLDHLTTRMRRHAEGLVLLSGGTAGRKWRGTIPVEDVLNGAAAQVEDYTRVRVYPMPECGVSGAAVADLMHLFAELIENAAQFSSPENEVSIRGELVGRGYAIEIEDRGLGLSVQERQAINERLAGPQQFDASQTERLGFAVVGLLAARHGVAVTLKQSPYGGTTAIVLLPNALTEPLAAIEGPPDRVVSPINKREGAADLPRRTRTSRRVDVKVERVDRQEPVVVRGPFEDAKPRGPFEAVTSMPLNAPVVEEAPAVLPRRIRRTNLPSRLASSTSPQQEPAGERAADERSPEETRALLSSLQSGWQRGRQDSEQDGGA